MKKVEIKQQCWFETVGCEELDRLCCCLVPDKYPRMNLGQDFYQHGLDRMGMSMLTSSGCNHNDNLVSRRRIFLLDLNNCEFLLVSVRRVVLTYSIPPVDTKDQRSCCVDEKLKILMIINN